MFTAIRNFFYLLLNPTPAQSPEEVFLHMNEISTINASMKNEYQRDLLFCAATLVGEARSEGYDGMHAVTNVAVNRLKSPVTWWHRNKGDGVPDDTLAAVCIDPLQFSCWNDGRDRGRKKDPNYDRCIHMANPDNFADNLKDRYFARAISVVSLALHGDLPDITKNSTHYHTKYINPSWVEGKKPIVSIGAHLFYNNIS